MESWHSLSCATLTDTWVLNLAGVLSLSCSYNFSGMQSDGCWGLAVREGALLFLWMSVSVPELPGWVSTNAVCVETCVCLPHHFTFTEGSSDNVLSQISGVGLQFLFCFVPLSIYGFIAFISSFAALISWRGLLVNKYMCVREICLSDRAHIQGYRACMLAYKGWENCLVECTNLFFLPLPGFWGIKLKLSGLDCKNL